MITLQITNGPVFQVPFVTGMNVEQAMQAVVNQSGPSAFIYAVQYYGKYGNLVLMINETYESFPATTVLQPFYYWELLVNGIPSAYGIDQTFLKDNDVIRFELSAYSNAIAGTSTMHAKHLYKTNQGNDK